jgi:DNA-binding transcriptional regulator YhcF (GntR family)
MEQSSTAEGFDLDGLDLSVDRGYDLPLGIQLAWKLRALIASGRIGPGERLPSVRELSKHAGVHVNTVRAVYSRLEDDGFVATRHGSGTFAADPAPAATDIERMASAAIADAQAEGLDPRDLATAIYAAAAPDAEDTANDRSRDRDDDEDPPASGAMPDLTAEPDTVPVRRELRRQIEKLEISLAAYPDSLRPPGPPPVTPLQPHVAGAGELEHSRNRLVDRVAEFGALAEARSVQRLESRLRLEEILDAPADHKWQRVDTGHLGEPGCRNWHAVPRLSVIGMLLGWWRVKVSSGCPLAEPRTRPTPSGH